MRRYRVQAVFEAIGGARPGERPAAPPEIAERFEGRAFTLLELEQRGVRIAGGRAVYTALARDWLLELSPPIR